MTTLPADELVKRLKVLHFRNKFGSGISGRDKLLNFYEKERRDATALIEAQAAEISSLRAKLAEAMEVVRLWVGWCDDWHPGKSHPVDDLARARRLIEENGNG